MDYYIVQPDLQRYRAVGPKHEVSFLEMADHLRDTKFYPNWSPLVLEVISDDPYDENQSASAALTDSMDLNAMGVHVISERAKTELGDFFQSDCELLPVLLAGSRYYVMHVILELNAIDFERSEVQRFQSGNIMSIHKYVLKESVIRDVDIFRLTGIRSFIVIVSDRFKDAVDKAKLGGFIFTKVEAV